MQAQELVLPHDTEEFGVDDEDNEEVDDVDTGSRHPDPWDKDPHSGVCWSAWFLRLRANSAVAIPCRSIQAARYPPLYDSRERIKPYLVGL